MALRLIVQGRVQGVGYRDWAARTAGGLGLAGWVRNRRDGSVELLAVGESEKIEAMTAACRDGPPLARVAMVRTESAEPLEASEGFQVLPTV